jgi:hypothetical protein
MKMTATIFASGRARRSVRAVLELPESGAHGVTRPTVF